MFASRSTTALNIVKSLRKVTNRHNVMLVLLCFPTGSNLTTEHYAANKVTGKLNSKIMPCLATHNVAGKKVEQWVDFIQWKVALYEAKPRNICAGFSRRTAERHGEGHGGHESYVYWIVVNHLYDNCNKLTIHLSSSCSYEL